MNVVYAGGGTNKSLDPDMDLSKIATVQGKRRSTITVPANSTTEVPVQLKMPAKEFNGYVLGSVVVTKLVPKDAKKASGFTNQFMYTKMVKITESAIFGVVTVALVIGLMYLLSLEGNASMVQVSLDIVLATVVLLAVGGISVALRTKK